MSNLHIITTTDRVTIISQLKSLTTGGCHFTNGTNAYEAEKIIPTTIAGFKRVTEIHANLPLVLAINSDLSMKALGKEEVEPQLDRANKVAESLALAFPHNQVVILFFDETTPNKLFQALNRHHLTRTLHKWGYGTDPEAPKIEGAELFEHTFGFPLPQDDRPKAFCHDLTDKPDQPQNIIVDDLRGKLINKERQLMFEIPDSLAQFRAPNAPLPKPKEAEEATTNLHWCCIL